MPAPFLQQTSKKIPAFLGGRGGKFFDICQTGDITGFLKRDPTEGNRGCLFICRWYFIPRCHRPQPRKSSLVDGLVCCGCRLQGSVVCVPSAVGEQAQISIYPRSFKNCIPDKFCENGSVPGGEGPSQQHRFCCCQSTHRTGP